MLNARGRSYGGHKIHNQPQGGEVSIGALDPGWLDEGKLVQFRTAGLWGSVRVSGLRFQVSGCNMGEPSRGYAGCRGSPQAPPPEPLLLGESH